MASHINLTIGTHYCRGHAVETKVLFGETHMTCGMEDMDESCNVSGARDLIYNTPGCCENHYQALPASDDFLKDAPQFSFTAGFIAALVDSVLNGERFPNTADQPFTDYLAPPLEKDVQVLFQTFII